MSSNFTFSKSFNICFFQVAFSFEVQTWPDHFKWQSRIIILSILSLSIFIWAFMTKDIFHTEDALSSLKLWLWISEKKKTQKHFWLNSWAHLFTGGVNLHWAHDSIWPWFSCQPFKCKAILDACQHMASSMIYISARFQHLHSPFIQKVLPVVRLQQSTKEKRHLFNAFTLETQNVAICSAFHVCLQ